MHGGALGAQLFAARLRESLGKLERRLGGSRHQQLDALMQAALARQAASGDVDLHRAWITALVREYYDPMYAYQRESRRDRIVFEGDERAVLDYLRGRATPGGS